MATLTGFAAGAFLKQTLAGTGDTTPDAFSISPSTGAPLSTIITSVSFTPVGYDTAAAISIANGEYELDASGTWVSTPGTINPGQAVRVRRQSSGSNNTAVTATLTIGGVNADYTITTIPASAGGTGGLVISFRRGRR